jgi:hypothetical protein
MPVLVPTASLESRETRRRSIAEVLAEVDAWVDVRIPAPAGKDPTLHDWGGSVLTQPTVTNVYLGDYWQTPEGQGDVAHNDAFAQSFSSSDMNDVVRQYRWAALPKFKGSTFVPGPAPERLTDADLQQLLRDQIAAGTITKSHQGIFNVVLPPKTVLVSPTGNTSLEGMGGYHRSFDLTPGSSPIYYSVIVYGDETNGANLNGNSRDNITIVETHEWTEVATDPDVGRSDTPGRNVAWMNFRWGEVADTANFLLPIDEVWTRDKAGFAVQLIWSNKDKAFEIAPRR